jgi:transposase
VASPSEETRRVQNLVGERRKLVEEKTAQVNRLIGYLKIYFPQRLLWFARLDTKLVCEFLERWPSLEVLKKVPPAERRKFFRQRRAGIMNSPKIASKASSKPCPPFRIER